MTREEAKKYLPIIQAYIDGKQVQWLDETGRWHDANDKLLTFYSPPSNYRIKLEPKYRPFKTKKECWNEMHKHPDFGWIKGNVTGEYKQVIRVSNYDTELIFNISHNSSADYSPEMMFSSYTFADGSPFGIKEE